MLKDILDHELYADEPSYSGNPRRVGVEIEFHGLEIEVAARILQDLFGGEIYREETHRCVIANTQLGTFATELDMSLSHAPHSNQNDDAPSSAEVLAEMVGDIGALVMPSEIVCPPLPVSRLPELFKIVDRLRSAGARGSGNDLLHACGVHVNPEVTSLAPKDIARTIAAYGLLSTWLRTQITIDLPRWLMRYATPFPASYVDLVTGQNYGPDETCLIDDYLAFNSTRNRELDMLPLFVWMDGDRVRRAINDPLVKARPTYHWRLPNAAFSRPEWSLSLEWHRWRLVEQLARDDVAYDDLASLYRENRARVFEDDWASIVSDWLGPRAI